MNDYPTCAQCGCLGQLYRECQVPMPEKIWHGSWRNVDSVTRTSIVWMMNKDELLEEGRQSCDDDVVGRPGTKLLPLERGAFNDSVANFHASVCHMWNVYGSLSIFRLMEHAISVIHWSHGRCDGAPSTWLPIYGLGFPPKISCSLWF